MSEPWDDGRPYPDLSVGLLGWTLAILRGVPLLVILLLGLLTTLALRPIERAMSGENRPLTPTITRIVCRLGLILVSLRLEVRGAPIKGGGVVVANHSSWLDILVLNTPKRLYFVAKSEVKGWAGIGWLARATGTVFVRRDRREAQTQVMVFQQRLALGHKLLFFPEGTSTDSLRVLPFKTTLFAAFFADSLRDTLRVQPVSVVYHAPRGRDARFYGWWGGMDLGPHLLAVLACPRSGRVEVIYHEPVQVADFADRKTLAAHCEAAVRGPVLRATLA